MKNTLFFNEPRGRAMFTSAIGHPYYPSAAVGQYKTTETEEYVLGEKTTPTTEQQTTWKLPADRRELLELVKAQVHSPLIDFLCTLLTDVAQFGHICAFVGNREFVIHDTKTFAELLNLRSKQQKPKSYLQIARALKSYEERLLEGQVLLRKVKDKRNHFKFFPDMP